MPIPSYPRWVVDEAHALYKEGNGAATIAEILAAKGAKSPSDGTVIKPKTIENFIYKLFKPAEMGPQPKKTRAPYGSKKKANAAKLTSIGQAPVTQAISLVPARPEDDEDFALLLDVIKRKMEKKKKIAVLKTLISTME